MESVLLNTGKNGTNRNCKGSHSQSVKVLGAGSLSLGRLEDVNSGVETVRPQILLPGYQIQVVSGSWGRWKGPGCMYIYIHVYNDIMIRVHFGSRYDIIKFKIPFSNKVLSFCLPYGSVLVKGTLSIRGLTLCWAC